MKKNEIQVIKNKMNLNNRKINNHSPYIGQKKAEPIISAPRS